MSNIMRNIRQCVMSILVIVTLVGAGIWIGVHIPNEAEPFEMSDSRFDLKLPGEVEKRIVTIGEIESKLVEASELCTYTDEYTVPISAAHPRYMLDNIPVPGTTNSISMECTGVVRVNYDVNDMIPTVDTESETIYISIPEPSSIDNLVDLDNVIVSENNNILNPIDFGQYHALINDAKTLGLTQAEEDGLYEAAEANVKAILENYLAGFEYDVKFI